MKFKYITEFIFQVFLRLFLKDFKIVFAFNTLK